MNGSSLLPAEPAQRRIRMLRTAMGPEIAAALEDPEVVEVLLNPDGSLWVDRLGSGRCPTGHHMPAPVAERIIRLVAAHVRAEVHPGAPHAVGRAARDGRALPGRLAARRARALVRDPQAGPAHPDWWTMWPTVS
jgi:Flp pilus assembly CpaF family ATPase